MIDREEFPEDVPMDEDLVQAISTRGMKRMTIENGMATWSEDLWTYQTPVSNLEFTGMDYEFKVIKRWEVRSI